MNKEYGNEIIGWLEQHWLCARREAVALMVVSRFFGAADLS